MQFILNIFKKKLLNLQKKLIRDKITQKWLKNPYPHFLPGNALYRISILCLK